MRVCLPRPGPPSRRLRAFCRSPVPFVLKIRIVFNEFRLSVTPSFLSHHHIARRTPSSSAYPPLPPSIPPLSVLSFSLLSFSRPCFTSAHSFALFPLVMPIKEVAKPLRGLSPRLPMRLFRTSGALGATRCFLRVTADERVRGKERERKKKRKKN